MHLISARKGSCTVGQTWPGVTAPLPFRIRIRKEKTGAQTRLKTAREGCRMMGPLKKHKDRWRGPAFPNFTPSKRSLKAGESTTQSRWWDGLMGRAKSKIPRFSRVTLIREDSAMHLPSVLSFHVDFSQLWRLSKQQWGNEGLSLAYTTPTCRLVGSNILTPKRDNRLPRRWLHDLAVHYVFIVGLRVIPY